MGGGWECEKELRKGKDGGEDKVSMGEKREGKGGGGKRKEGGDHRNKWGKKGGISGKGWE